ncbi:helix-turn-helix transcriptional regulator [Paenibacillus hodogayensis]|uniref:helix-turn-helix transcriptional regulator n=1 Tax=Paenibacillus hodogayensis TaxID=279208 RepID=UPI00337F14CC
MEDLDARWGKRDIENRIGMVLRFHPRAKVKVEEYFPPEEITITEDGYFIVRTEHTEDVWLYGTLLSYGTDVTVLEPKHLADSIKERVLQIYNLYE